MKRVIIGFYDVPGYGPDSVETEVTNKPREDYLTLNDLIRKRFPRTKVPQDIKRTGSIVELRDDNDPGYVEVPIGTTIAQLFGDGNGNNDPSRVIGRVFFSGTPADIVLVYLRAQGSVTVNLKPVLRKDGLIHFGNRLSPMRLASELPQLIKEILGHDARDLKLKFRESEPRTKA